MHDRRRPRRLYTAGAEPDPRFTLANERTLLAWLRTALAFVVTGVGAVALEPVVAGSVQVVVGGAAACGVGSVVAGAAYLRWQRVELALRLDRPLPAPRIAALLVLALVVLAAGGLVALLWSVR